MKKSYLFFLLLISPLSFFTFWKVLSFDFFQDDYFFLWNGLHDPFVQFINFRHPGTPLEALLLGHILGQNAFLWELLGIFLKIIASFLTGIFLYKLTNSKLAGFLAGIFSSVSVAGMYVINAFNFHLPALVGICILISLIFLIDYIHKNNKQSLWKFSIFLAVAFLLDPARAIPIIPVLFFIPFFFLKSKEKVRAKRFTKKFFIIFFSVAVPILAFWYIRFGIGHDTQLEIFLKGIRTNPKYFIPEIKYIGNFFATIANLFSEIIYGLKQSPPKYETAYYTRTFGLGGIILLFAGIGSFLYYLRKKSQFFLTISFFILWIFLFYLPNWLAEPRIPMTTQNHYLFLSGIGYLCLIAYLLSFMQKRWLVIVLSVVFIFLNVWKVNTTLALEFPFRSVKVVENSMRKVVKNVPKNESGDIFFFSGDEYWLYYSITYWGNYHVLLLRNNTSAKQLPSMTFDEGFVVDLLCKGLPLSHVYSWNVPHPEVFIDIISQERERLKGLISQRTGCNLEEK